MIRGVGVDIVEIARVKRAVETRRERFLNRVFTDDEQAYCLGKKQPHRHLAVRFAAKEAVVKCLGTGKQGMRWTDIEIRRDSLGKPYVRLHGGAARRAAERGVADVAISLSFTGHSAVASAVAIGGLAKSR